MTNENSMVLAEAEDVITPTNAAIARGIYASRELDAVLRSAGAQVEHVGGSLPSIEFVRVGECVLARYSERRDPENKAQFNEGAKILVLDVLDPAIMGTTRDWRAARMYTGQIFEGAAIKSWTAEKTNLGKIVKLTYYGEVETKRNGAPMRQFTIQEVTFK